MSKKSNDSVEEFFKKGVRRSDITFRESDWQKMEKLLDEKAMVGSAGASRTVKGVIGGVVILLLISTVFILMPEEKKTLAADQKKETITAQKQPEIVSPISVDEPAKVSSHQSQKEPIKATPQNQQGKIQNTARANANTSRRSEASLKESEASPKESDKNISETTSRSPSQTQVKEEEDAPARSFSADTENVARERNADQVSDVAKQENDEQTMVANTQTQRGVSGSERLNKETTITTERDSIAQPQKEEKPLVENSTEKDQDKKDNASAFSRWNVAVVVAPDFSSTSLDRQTAPGSAYGLMIGYRIVDRITISAGVLKTSKKYVGYGKDYQPPEGYWQFKTNGIVPDEVKGQCAVIEIPLMLQYDLRQTAKSRIFVSGGVSSYRMMNESYQYTFNEPNDGAAQGWSSTAPSSYYFSVGHLSAAYERTVYRGLSLGVEPYVKIPFKGIGWSNVDLLTLGAYVNLRYRFSNRN